MRYNLTTHDYSNKIVEGKKFIWLQQCGWAEAKPAIEFKTGEFMMWNSGSESKVVSVVKETAKTMVFNVEWKKYLGGYETGDRKFTKERWVAIGTGKNY